MAKQERYIDADALIEKLKDIFPFIGGLPIPYNNYGSTSFDSAMAAFVNQQVLPIISSSMDHFKFQIIQAIEDSATLKGTPCFLCKQRDSDEIPANPYAGCSKAA